MGWLADCSTRSGCWYNKRDEELGQPLFLGGAIGAAHRGALQSGKGLTIIPSWLSVSPLQRHPLQAMGRAGDRPMVDDDAAIDDGRWLRVLKKKTITSHRTIRVGLRHVQVHSLKYLLGSSGAFHLDTGRGHNEPGNK